MADLDYVYVIGRFGLTVGDGADPGEEADTDYCDEGTIKLTPKNVYTKVAGATPIPTSLGNATLTPSIDTSGFLLWNGLRRMSIPDMTSEKVNPYIPAGRATHRVEFVNVKSQGTKVAFESADVRIAADTAVPLSVAGAAAIGLPVGTMVCILSNILPVPSGGGTAIVQGPRGIGVEALGVEGGNLVYELTDGTTEIAGELPVGPGGSDAGVASYLANPASQTALSVAAKIATQVADITTFIGYILPSDPGVLAITFADVNENNFVTELVEANV